MDRAVPIVIPAYEPDEKLIGLMDKLNEADLGPVIVVDDGSDKEIYGAIFDEVRKRGGEVLTHAVNMGKGRGLKTAFNHCLNQYPNLFKAILAALLPRSAPMRYQYTAIFKSFGTPSPNS